MTKLGMNTALAPLGMQVRGPPTRHCLAFFSFKHLLLESVSLLPLILYSRLVTERML